MQTNILLKPVTGFTIAGLITFLLLIACTERIDISTKDAAPPGW